MENKPHPLAILAKATVEKHATNGGEIKIPDDIAWEYLNQKAGVFVTIKKNGELRGCVGTYEPTKNNIAQETIANALAAAFNDPRFDPVAKDDLSQLSFEISILEKPEQIADISELDPKIYGVLVFATGSGKSGLLLPDLDGVNTAQQQLAIACRKAGIDPFSEKIATFRFKIKKIS